MDAHDIVTHSDELFEMHSAQQQLFEEEEWFHFQQQQKEKAVKPRQQSVSNFKPVDEGVHVGVITGLVDLGLQPGGKFDDAYKVALIVTIPGQLTEKGEPMTLTTTQTSSLNKKANLRKWTEAIFGKAFPSEEAANNFEMANLVGKAGLFSVAHKQNGDKVYANITGVMALPAGMPKPDVNPSTYLIYDPDLPAEARVAAFDRLPEFLRKKVTEQLQPPSAPQEQDPGPQDEDIPF